MRKTMIYLGTKHKANMWKIIVTVCVVLGSPQYYLHLNCLRNIVSVHLYDAGTLIKISNCTINRFKHSIMQGTNLELIMSGTLTPCMISSISMSTRISTLKA